MSYVYKNSKGVDWYLNCKEVTLKGGQTQKIYFFSKDQRDTGCDLPADKQVVENAANGFPICKNK
ncbi:hypothetical protein F4X86_00445 [Candidatus Saccharibacteria bacterium]|nr:hypothetical protein [Candidatus Saccharibacteria bacterium]